MSGLGSTALIGGALAGGAVGGGLLGGGPDRTIDARQINLLTGGIKAGGLRTGVDPNTRTVSVQSSRGRKALVNNIADLFGTQAGELGRLRGQLAPGFGALTRTRREAIRNAARRSVGNLTDQLARRRVLGSSFGSDAIARAGREFGQAEAEADAQSFLEEFTANVQLLNQQSEAARNQFLTKLQEKNVQADLAMGLLTNSQAAIANAEQLATQLYAAYQSDLAGVGAESATLAGFGLGNLPQVQALFGG